MKNKIKTSCKKIREIIENSTSPDDTLFGGKSGRAIYYAYLYQITKDEKYLEKAIEDIEYIFDQFGSYKPRISGASFSVGAAGFAYMVSHLNNNKLMEFDMDADFESIDDYLFDAAIKYLKEGETDYLHQAFGIAYYFSTRLPNPRIEYFLNEILSIFNDKLVKDDLGYRILTTFGPREGKAFDFSLAHGLSGLVCILISIYENGYKNENIELMISESINYMLNFYNPPKEKGELSYFPLSVNSKTLEKEKSNMLAWCYGDLGVALALHRGCKIIKNKEWESKLKKIQKALAARTEIEGNLVVHDSHFCHGASGVAQFYLTLYELSEYEPYLKAYNKWIAHTQILLEKDLDNKFYLDKECGILEGLVGVGLTLETYLHKKPLNWSKTLLL